MLVNAIDCFISLIIIVVLISQAFSSAAMDILFVHPASQGFRTNALLVDKSLGTSGV